MNELSLFSGIGGFSLAASWVWGDEHEIVGFCEIDKFCQKVLRKHWPDVHIFDDIKELNYEKIVAESYCSNGRCKTGDSLHKRWASGKNWGTCLSENSEREDGPSISDNQPTNSNGRTESKQNDFTIDLITGGFPCQPFSVAGKRRGKEDDRHLWPEYLRLIQEIRPRWIIGENVAGIIRMELDTVLSDLESEGYSCQSVVIPACTVNAPHRRDRVWIVANRTESGLQKPGFTGNSKLSEEERAGVDIGRRNREVDTNPNGNGLQEPWAELKTGRSGQSIQGGEQWSEPWLEVATRLCRVDDGISRKLDRVNRLKALGNAIVPQVVYEIMKAIKGVDVNL